MNHTVLGRLRGSLLDDCDHKYHHEHRHKDHQDDGDHQDSCNHCREPLAGAVVRIYSVDDPAGGSTGAPRILDNAAVEARAARRLAEATTYPDGTFAATLPESYDGGALDIDVYCRTVPGSRCRDKPRDPVQVHVARLRPEWAGERYPEISFDYVLPESTWLKVRAWFGAWVICGRVVERESREKVAGAVVRAFDTDWLQDDPLGATTTDHDGRFRLDYTRRDFERAVLSPLINLEAIHGPDLYFRVESYTGATVLNEPRSTGRTAGRENVRLYTCLELEVTGPASLPHPRDPKWDERRKYEIDTSFKPGRAPIARVGDVYFRPWELLLSAKAAEQFHDELTERYGARHYVPDPDDPDDWRSHQRDASGRCRNVNSRLSDAGIDLQVYVLSRDVGPIGVVDVVKSLRSRFPERADDPDFGVHLNHVMFAEPFYQGGPGGAPEICQPPLEWPSGGSTPPGVDVAVLDTGVWHGWSEVHSALLDTVRPDGEDWDLLDIQEPVGLDTCAGHGLFICGLIYRLDSSLRVDPGKVLSPVGDGDDATVAPELAQTGAQVVNLSLGCHTMDDAAAPATAQAINDLLDGDAAVVAAAGNNHDGGTVVPFWPAAMPKVIAVGSWDVTPSGTRVRASTSNYGSWVDVYARGAGVISTYVTVDGFSGWARWSGTSFAAPQVAAAIAIQVKKNPQKTPKQVAADMLGSGSSALPAWPNPADGNPAAKLYVSDVDLTT